MDAILNEWDKRCLKDFRMLAYMLATTYHETAKTMQPIEEYGKGRGYKYGKVDPKTGKAYYGRGFVQLTWDYNYKKLGSLLKIPLYESPELALNTVYATQVLFEGMLTAASAKGDFTGKSLEMYFSDTKEDWLNARRIINGLDRAELIADYGKRFYKAIKQSI
jgi:putative chitinase